MRGIFTFAAVLGALAVAPSLAAADVRYAAPSPSGSGIVCTSPAPCDIVEALQSSGYGDEVVITPGTYGSVGTPISAMLGQLGGNDLNVHGVLGQPRPVIHSNANYGLFLNSSNNPLTPPRLSHVELHHTEGIVGVRSGRHSRISDVYVEASSLSGAACSAVGNYSNSLCIGRDSANAFSTTTDGAGTAPVSELRNVTAMALGSSGFGLMVDYSGGFRGDIKVVNSIVRGASGDVRAIASGAGSTTTIELSNSNYSARSESQSAGGSASVTPAAGSATNQTSPPLLNNTATGDFHQLPGSPTIDAGADAAENGATDFDGVARIQGARTDIGAFEFPVAAATNLVFTTITGLKAHSKAFTRAKSGSAFRSSSAQPKKQRGKKPVGTLVSFTLNQADTVNFKLQRAYVGRKSKGKCVKKTRSNAKKKKCFFYKTLPGTETVAGAAGKTTVWWTGRWNGKPLSTSGAGYSLLGTPIKASTGNEPGTLTPRPVKALPK